VVPLKCRILSTIFSEFNLLLAWSNYFSCHPVENESGGAFIIVRKKFDIAPVFPFKKLVFGGKKDVEINIASYVYQQSFGSGFKFYYSAAKIIGTGIPG
jgi:hypothetical protein